MVGLQMLLMLMVDKHHFITLLAFGGESGYHQSVYDIHLGTEAM